MLTPYPNDFHRNLEKCLFWNFFMNLKKMFDQYRDYGLVLALTFDEFLFLF
jgi:hypothetical protein